VGENSGGDKASQEKKRGKKVSSRDGRAQGKKKRRIIGRWGSGKDNKVTGTGRKKGDAIDYTGTVTPGKEDGRRRGGGGGGPACSPKKGNSRKGLNNRRLARRKGLHSLWNRNKKK